MADYIYVSMGALYLQYAVRDAVALAELLDVLDDLEACGTLTALPPFSRGGASKGVGLPFGVGSSVEMDEREWGDNGV